MPVREIEFHAGEYYHVYNRGCDRQKLFFSRKNYEFFLNKLKAVCHEEQIRVVAWCLMPNHYHLLLQPDVGDLARAILRLGLSYSKAINKERGRSGTLFEGRFHAVHVDYEEYLLYLTRYLHRNPVEAGLVSSCAEWEFSSYWEYLNPETSSFVASEAVLREFGTIESYRKFVESNRNDGMGKIAHLLIDG